VRPRPERAQRQLLRFASLVLPPAVAWNVAFAATERSRLTDAVVYALGPLWLASASALAWRSVDALLARRRDGRSELTLLDRLDLLTSAGAALSWLGALGIVLSVWVGWASLSVVGLMGTALLQMVVLWTLLVAGGADPFRVASLSRRFLPERAVEGEPVIEELSVVDARIPTGFRLLGEGHVGARWATSRYVVDETASGGELVLESDLGPAIRGEHQAEPLTFWLQDVFGLCRSVRRRVAATPLTVLPAIHPVTGARELLGAGGRDREPRPATRLPTEGSLRLREYQPGDDARRVHWVRSLAARELIVRLPDEIPPDRPAVRVVLDTFLPGTEAFSCNAPAALLDALVQVWLSVGRALGDAGARVTLVIVSSKGEEHAAQEIRLSQHSMAQALRLGAQARWQSSLPVEALLSKEPTFLVSCRTQPLLAAPELTAEAHWIVVPEPAWTCFDEPLPARSVVLFPHPLGSPDNRWSRRLGAQRGWWRALRDHSAFTRHSAGTINAGAGSFCARPMRASPSGPRQIALEALR
jgi:uncharacterized protein (DUF58 family)